MLNHLSAPTWDGQGANTILLRKKSLSFDEVVLAFVSWIAYVYNISVKDSLAY